MGGIKTVTAVAVGLVTAAAPIIGVTAAADAAALGYHRVAGTSGADRLVGTSLPDLLSGSAGADILRPQAGADIVRAAGGDDRIFLFNDGVVDRIHCGEGFDVVSYKFSVDQRDVIDANCEGEVA